MIDKNILIIKERLREALEHVSFCADGVFRDPKDLYYKRNLNLYTDDKRWKEQRKFQPVRPRNVRDCIPSSKLAVYADNCYYEPREMSYACNSSAISHVPFSFQPSEPWELFEVDELFHWYTMGTEPMLVEVDPNSSKRFKEMLADRICNGRPRKMSEEYDSPLFQASTFDDKILKMHLSEDKLKNIWMMTDDTLVRRKTPGKVDLHICFSPLRKYYVRKDNIQFNYHWYYQMNGYRDIAQIENLCKFLRDETNKVESMLRSPAFDSQSLNSEPSSEVLYSEVLQGLASAKKAVKQEQHKQTLVPSNDFPSTSKINKEDQSFTNFTVLNKQKDEKTLLSYQKMEQQQQMYVLQTKHKSVSSLPPSQLKDLFSKLSTPKPPPFAPAELISRTTAGMKLPSDQLSLNSGNVHPKGLMLQPQAANFIPQTIYYAPIQPTAPVQRWIPPTTALCYQNPAAAQIYNTAWLAQSQMILPVSYELNRLINMPLTPKPDYSTDSNSLFNKRSPTANAPGQSTNPAFSMFIQSQNVKEAQEAAKAQQLSAKALEVEKPSPPPPPPSSKHRHCEAIFKMLELQAMDQYYAEKLAEERRLLEEEAKRNSEGERKKAKDEKRESKEEQQQTDK